MIKKAILASGRSVMSPTPRSTKLFVPGPFVGKAGPDADDYSNYENLKIRSMICISSSLFFFFLIPNGLGHLNLKGASRGMEPIWTALLIVPRSVWHSLYWHSTNKNHSDNLNIKSQFGNSYSLSLAIERVNAFLLFVGSNRPLRRRPKNSLDKKKKKKKKIKK